VTLFLASVNGPREAEIALAGGADIIDLKDPTQGALGAAPTDVVRATVAEIAGRRPVSAVTGDLPMEPRIVADTAATMAATGLDYVKVGIFPGPRRGDCVRALMPLTATTKVVAVIFADLDPDLAMIPLCAECGFAGVMFDTARKASGGLMQCMEITALAEFIAACRARGLMAGLAGSLEAPDIPRLLPLSPDLLGFRTALCAGQQRVAAIDPAAVRIVRELIPIDPRCAGCEQSQEAVVDYRLLAARGYSSDHYRRSSESDKVFVRDFVLPVRIGAYSRERGKPQRVRFNIEVELTQPPHAARDIRDVLSYDVVTDGIRMIVAREHIGLLETLVERVAALVLAHDWALRTTIRAEKLDVIAGGVGVEITRERPDEVAKVHELFPVAGSKAAE
jgi:dihydroneopterin aldolase